MSASIHRFPRHPFHDLTHHVARRRPDRGRVARLPQSTARGQLFVLGFVLFVVAFALLGVWLVDGVSSVGRVDNGCLESARRVCGLFPGM